MSKYLCCGTSKKTNIESENEEYQLLLLGKILSINNFSTRSIIYIGPDQSGKFNIIEQISTLQNQFTHQ